MSADNMICVQKRLDGRWWVWMGFASGDVQPDADYDYHFPTHEDAMLYASGWRRGEMFLEYGIVELEPQAEPESQCVVICKTVKCPHCGDKLGVSFGLRAIDHSAI